MRHIFLSFLFFLWAVSASATDPKVYFSPSFDCEKAIIKRISNAQQTVDVAVYSINNPRLIGTLISAHQSGKKVRVLTDGNQAEKSYSRVHELEKANIPVVRTVKRNTMHDTFVVVDKEKAVSGSFNWTQAATFKNTENCILFDDNPETVSRYQNRFEELWKLFSEASENKKTSHPSKNNQKNGMEPIF